MSQEDVFEILKEIGGEGTIKEIREAVKKKYPARTLSLYILNRLKKLEINNRVEFKQGKWIIKKKLK